MSIVAVMLFFEFNASVRYVDDALTEEGSDGHLEALLAASEEVAYEFGVGLVADVELAVAQFESVDDGLGEVVDFGVADGCWGDVDFIVLADFLDVDFETVADGERRVDVALVDERGEGVVYDDIVAEW